MHTPLETLPSRPLQLSCLGLLAGCTARIRTPKKTAATDPTAPKRASDDDPLAPSGQPADIDESSHRPAGAGLSDESRDIENDLGYHQ